MRLAFKEIRRGGSRGKEKHEQEPLLTTAGENKGLLCEFRTGAIALKVQGRGSKQARDRE